MAEDEKRLRSVKNLLEWSVEQQGDECRKDLKPISKDDARWLNEALRHYTGADDVTVMKQCLQVLKTTDSGVSSTETELGEKRLEASQDALDLIAEKVDLIDNARDFITIGGLPIILAILQTDAHSLQWRAAEVLSVLVQNNPFCQSQVFASGGLDILVNVGHSSQDDLVKTKALYAISSLTRGFPDALKAFLCERGIGVMVTAIKSKSEKLKTKAIFLLKNIAEEHSEAKGTLCSYGFVQELTELLRHADSAGHLGEHIAGALLSLATDCPQGLSQCKHPGLALKETLEEMLRLHRGDDGEYREEIEYCTELLRLCSTA